MDFATDIDNILGYMGVNQRGASAFREGFCLTRIVRGYSPVWVTGSIIYCFITPSMGCIMASPQVRQVIARITSRVNSILGNEVNELDTSEEVEVAAQLMQRQISELLTQVIPLGLL